MGRWGSRAIWGSLAAMSMAVGSAGGIAFASSTDNLVPTANYHPACSKGGAGHGVVCQTDNSKVYYYMDSHGKLKLESVDKSIVRNMLSDQYSPTHLQIHYDSTPRFHGKGETDIVYQEGSVGSDFDGYTWCDDPSPSPKYECDQTVVRIRGAGYYSPGLSCHETGHAVGLTHGPDASPKRSKTAPLLGCMRTPIGWYEDALGANQRHNINQHYPSP